VMLKGVDWLAIQSTVPANVEWTAQEQELLLLLCEGEHLKSSILWSW